MFVNRPIHLERIETSFGPRTAASFDGVELINKMERVYWDALLQIRVYHGPYDNDIVYGNYVELSRLNRQVVWSVPRIDTPDDWARQHFYPSQLVTEGGLVVFDEKVWKQLCSEDHNVLNLSCIDPLSFEQLLWSWLWRWFEDRRLFGIQELVPHIRRLIVASRTLEVDNALKMLKHLVEVMSQSGAASGQLVPLDRTDATPEVLYLGDPPCEEVVLFALWRGQACPVIGSTWMFVPG